ncbi:MAG TPA: glycosyltransferase family A protein [Armatimonadota bacterium]|nr:glycosyltransferase family A protein [Armatimonadota bacterium]
MRIDLILWPDSPPVRWEHGEQRRLPATTADAARAIAEHLAQGDPEWLLFWDGRCGHPPAEPLQRWMRRGADAVHGGLNAGAGGQPEALEYVVSDWSWIDAPADRITTSWRLSLRCALLRTTALRTVGGLDPAFETLEGAGLEVGYRLLRRGGLVFHDPGCLPRPLEGCPPTLTDCYVFVRRWFKPHWTRYLQLRRLMGGCSPLSEMRAAAAATRACGEWKAPDHTAVIPRMEYPPGRPPRPSITAVIPTLGRYPYVPAALSSLAEQTVRPEEILVVDQNPADSRRPEVYEPYSGMNVRVLWQDQRGQSLARNVAIAEAQGEYLFLFEDDAVAEPDLIEQHLRLLHACEADVSTGVSLPPPPTDYVLPEEFRFPRVAQTFSSGNSLLTRRALGLAGGFDRNYDHGVNADMDFGTRLYLAGGVIVHNPHAVMVHYKAPMGGLREYGHWWAHSNVGLLRPFPPPTQVYYMLRFLTPRQRRERLLRFITLAALGWDKRQSHGRRSRLGRVLHGVASMPLMPYRLSRSFSEATRLLAEGPQIPAPPEPRIKAVA